VTHLELVGRTIAGRYRIEKQLGAGGMGAVYLAVQSPLERRVALKVLHPSLTESADAEARFAREAQSSSHLSHPNIVAVHDFGTDEKMHYLVMELVDGESLLEVLARERVLSLERASKIVAGVCDALTFAHERGVIHRDIKPANVMLLSTPADFVKVLDFGIAKVRGWETLTADGAVLGTPGYVPPELFEPEGKPSTSSDLYALGVMLFEMLTGRQPFLGDTPMQLIKQAVMNDPPRPSELAEVPAPVEALILELLAKTPEGRPPSAQVAKERLLEAARVSTSELSTEVLDREEVIDQIQPPETVETIERPPEVTSTPLPLAAKVVLGIGAAATLAVMFAGWMYGWNLGKQEEQTLGGPIALLPSALKERCDEGDQEACADYKRVTTSMIPEDVEIGIVVDGEARPLRELKIAPRSEAPAAGARWSQPFRSGAKTATLSALGGVALRRLVDVARQGAKVEIVGHWISGESEEIGMARAGWMQDELLARGLPSGSISGLRAKRGAVAQATAEIR
jgi:hypothetical protein